MTPKESIQRRIELHEGLIGLLGKEQAKAYGEYQLIAKSIEMDVKALGGKIKALEEELEGD